MIERYKIGSWHFAVKKTERLGNPKRAFIAWAAQYADLGSGPLAVPFDVATYFEFGPSSSEALAKLKNEIATISPENF